MGCTVPNRNIKRLNEHAYLNKSTLSSMSLVIFLKVHPLAGTNYNKDPAINIHHLLLNSKICKRMAKSLIN